MTAETFQPIDPELVELMTAEELAAYEQELIRQAALLTPLDYAVHCTDGRMNRYPHTDLLSRHAKALIEHALYPSGISLSAVWTPKADDPDDGAWRHPITGEEAHNVLVLSTPPQHGKSAIITETVPAWYLSLYPDRRAIVAGYEAEFSKEFGRQNRAKIENNPELGVEVNKESRAADNWSIKGHSGGLITAGVGGGITGKRADLIIIDDPVKSSEDALSEAYRRKAKNWWQSVVKSRFRTDTVAIVIQTRWHEDDLAGHITETERCYTLNLPALAFDNAEGPDPETGIARDPDDYSLDPLGRKPGEALCPALQTRSMLLKKQVSGDSSEEPGGMLWFSALYQGKPNIEGGGILAKPYYYFTVEQNFSGRKFYKTKGSTGHTKESYVNEAIHFITSDLAASTKTAADWTVFSLWAYTPHNELLLVDIERSRMESPDHMPRAEAFFRKSVRAVGAVRFFGVEKETFGLSLLQTAARNSNVPFRPMEPDRDKTVRAIPAGMLIRQDELFLPKAHPLLVDLEKEMQMFPNGRHDDMVDTMGYAAHQVSLMPRRQPDVALSPVEQHMRDKGRRKGLHPIAGRMRW